MMAQKTWLTGFNKTFEIANASGETVIEGYTDMSWAYFAISDYNQGAIDRFTGRIYKLYTDLKRAGEIVTRTIGVVAYTAETGEEWLNADVTMLDDPQTFYNLFNGINHEDHIRLNIGTDIEFVYQAGEIFVGISSNVPYVVTSFLRAFETNIDEEALRSVNNKFEKLNMPEPRQYKAA